MCKTPIASIAYGLLSASVAMPSLPSHGKPAVLYRGGLGLRARITDPGGRSLRTLPSHGTGEPSRFVDSLAVFVRGGEGLALFGLLITLLWVAWERFSAIMFSLMLPTPAGLNAMQFVAAVFRSDGRGELALAWLVAGGILALVVFALSIVSVPLLIDRNSDFISATLTSFRVLGANPVTNAALGARDCNPDAGRFRHLALRLRHIHADSRSRVVARLSRPCRIGSDQLFQRAAQPPFHLRQAP